MQLNSKTNHSIIKITTVDVYGNKIKYDIYASEFEPSPVASKTLEIDLYSKINTEINYLEYAYSLLEGKESDYTISTSLNWKLTDKPVRIMIPNKVSTDAILEQNDLGKLLQSIIELNKEAETKFIFKEYNFAIAYFNTVSEDDQTVIQPYLDRGDIVIQIKP